ncbi:MAG: hypothetical protein ACLGG7_01445 [Bacteriovoracia bacterium]
MKSFFAIMLLTLSLSSAFASENMAAEDCEATRHSDERSNPKEVKEKTEGKQSKEGAVGA